MVELSKKLIKQVGKTNAEYGLIKEGDRVLVGLSGGKDSLTLVHSLKQIQRRAPFDFEFEAVTVSYGMGENFDQLIAHCKEHDIKHSIYETEIFDIAKDKIRTNSSFCSFFSRMRRGSLYTVAQEKGFNKLALGHHLDDAVESFFMNMFYNGALRSMPPIYRADNGVVVIRPLILCRERQLRAAAEENGMPTIGDEACPAMRFDVKMPHARAKTKEFVQKLEEDNKDIMNILKASFSHIHDDTLLDPKRWGEFAPEEE
jgi:tRNA(Ile)-lysidine synthase TilS/MesJ